MELGDLTVEFARGQALPQQLDAVHLGLRTASAVITDNAIVKWVQNAFKTDELDMSLMRLKVGKLRLAVLGMNH